MQVSSVDSKYKNQDIDEDEYESVDSSSDNENSDSESTDTDGFSLSGALKMVAGGKSTSGNCKTLTGNANDISKNAIAFSKDAEKGVKVVQGEVNEFEDFMAEQERAAAAEKAQIDDLYSQIDADTVTLEALFANSASPSGAPACAPAVMNAASSEPDDSSNGSVIVTPNFAGDDTTGTTDNSSEADTLTTRISSNQTNIYSLIANGARRSRTSASKSNRIKSKVKANKNVIKKAAAKQRNAENKTKSILKVAQTVSTIGSDITIASYIGQAIGWAMTLIPYTTALGQIIMNACKAFIRPVGDLICGVGKAGECAADIALGDTKAALMAGGQAILSFVSCASEISATAKACSATSAAAKSAAKGVTIGGNVVNGVKTPVLTMTSTINKSKFFAAALKSTSNASNVKNILGCSVDVTKSLSLASKTTHMAQAYTVGAQVMKKGS